MKMKCLVRGAWCVVVGAWCVVVGAVCVVLGAGCGTQDPFGRESTPEEDAVVIGGYTQTVNQASSSQDTTIAPVVNGNNNTVIVVIGDGNEPDAINTRGQPVEDAEAPVGTPAATPEE